MHIRANRRRPLLRSPRLLRPDGGKARGGEVSPTIIGTLRELALEAPEELIDDFETVSSASSHQEMDAALDNIETFLVEECGLEVRS